MGPIRIWRKEGGCRYRHNTASKVTKYSSTVINNNSQQIPNPGIDGRYDTKYT